MTTGVGGGSAPSARVGVVGGIGPLGGLAFLDALYAAARARSAGGVTPNASYPDILMASVPAPSSLRASDDIERSYAPVAARARELVGAGCSVLALACVTMHSELPRLAAEAGGRWVSLVDALADEIARRGGRRVVVLATETTARRGTVAVALERRGVSVLELTLEEQRALDALVRQLVERGAEEADPSVLATIARSGADRGADAVAVACTDLSAIARRWVSPLAIVDAVDVGAARVLDVATFGA